MTLFSIQIVVYIIISVCTYKGNANSSILEVNVTVHDRNNIIRGIANFVNRPTHKVTINTNVLPVTNQLLKFSATTNVVGNLTWIWRWKSLVISNTSQFEYQFDGELTQEIFVEILSDTDAFVITLFLKNGLVQTTHATAAEPLILQEQISAFNKGPALVGEEVSFLVLMFSRLNFLQASTQDVKLTLSLVNHGEDTAKNTRPQYTSEFGTIVRRDCMKYSTEALTTYLNNWDTARKSDNGAADLSTVIDDEELKSFCATIFSHTFIERGLYLTSLNLTTQDSSPQVSTIETCVPINPRCYPPIVHIRTGLFRSQVTTIFEAPVMKYKVGDTIELWADVLREVCLDAEESAIKMKWYVVNIKEFKTTFLSAITEKILTESKSALPASLSFEDTVGFKLEPGVLSIGTFLVVFSVKEWPYCGSDSVFVSDTVQLQISLPDLEATIDGGSYLEWPLINSNSVLQLNALTPVSDDIKVTWLCHKEYDTLTQFHQTIDTLTKRMIYKESGNFQGCFGNGYILATSDNIVEIPSTPGISLNQNILEISGEAFEELGHFVFTLFVVRLQDNATTSVQQKILIFQPESVISQLVQIGIKCIENCKEHVIPSRVMYVVSKCETCYKVKLGPGEQLAKLWTVESPMKSKNLKRRFSWNRDSAVDRESNNLILLPSAFQELGSYTIKLQVFFQARYNRKLISTAQYQFKAIKGPPGGLCVVEPNRGVALQTMFSIKCSNFGDGPGSLLRYEMILGDVVAQYNPGNEIVIYKGMDPSISGLNLPVGNPKFGYRKKIRVLVANQRDITTSATAFVAVLPPNLDDVDGLIESSLLGTKQSISQLARLVKAGNIDSAIRLILSASSLPSSKTTTSNLTASACKKVFEELSRIKVTNPETASQLMGIAADILTSWSTRFNENEIRNIVVELRRMTNVTMTYMTTATSQTLQSNSMQFESAGVATLKALSGTSEFCSSVDLPSIQVAVLEDKVKIHTVLSKLLKSGEIDKTFLLGNKETLGIGSVDLSRNNVPITTSRDGPELMLPREVSRSLQKFSFALSTMYYNPFNSGSSGDLDINLPAISFSAIGDADSLPKENSSVSGRLTTSSTYDVLLPLKSSRTAKNDSVDAKAIAKLLLPPPCNNSLNGTAKVAVNKGDCGSVAVKLNLEDEFSTRRKRSPRSANDPNVAFIVLRPKKPCRNPRAPCLRVSFSRLNPAAENCNPSYTSCPNKYDVIKMVTLPNFDDENKVKSFSVDPWSITTNRSFLNEIRGHGLAASEVTMLVEDLQMDALFKERSIDDKDNYQSVTVNIIRAECYIWNYKINGWDKKSCSRGKLVMGGKLHCQCQVPTGNNVAHPGLLASVPLVFAASLIVVPNTINFSDMLVLLSQLQTNFYVMLVISLWWLIFLPMFMWAVRADKRDDKIREIIIPEDIDTSDSFAYEVVIFTGITKNAGTTANVTIILENTSGMRSDPHVISDASRKLLRRGGVDSFMVTSAAELGKITKVHLWHDNTGLHPSWKLNRVVVHDMHSKYPSSFFIANSWLSLDIFPYSCQIEINMASEEEVLSFGNVWRLKFVDLLRDSNVWTSALNRAPCNPFTRVQRTACCMVAVFGCMLASIMFYDTFQSTIYQINIGYVNINLSAMVASVEAAVVLAPINILVNFIFRRIKPPEESAGNTFGSLRNLISLWRKKNKFKISSYFKTKLVKLPDVNTTNVEHRLNEPSNRTRNFESKSFMLNESTGIVENTKRSKDTTKNGFENQTTGVSSSSFDQPSTSFNQPSTRFDQQPSTSFDQPSTRFDQPSTSKSFQSTVSDESRILLDSIQDLTELKATCDSFTRISNDPHPVTISKKTRFVDSDYNSRSNDKSSDVEMNILEDSLAPRDPRDSEEKVDDEIHLTDNVKQWYLPEWFSWFAWVIVVLDVAICSFLTVVYGLHYGNSKFLNWLFTFALSIFQNMTVVSPARMVLMATGFAFIKRDTVEKRDWVGFTGKWARSQALIKWEEMKTQYEDLDHLREDSTEKEVGGLNLVSWGGIKRAGEIVKRPWCYRFPTEEGLVRAGKLRVAVSQVRRYWLEAISWTLLAFFVTSLIILQRDYRLLRLHNRARDYFVSDFYEIKAKGDIFSFLGDALVPALFKENEAAIADRFDLLGPIRIRQVRIKPDVCPELPGLKLNRSCKPENWEVNDLGYYDTADYRSKWERVDVNTLTSANNAWKYLDIGHDFGTKVVLGNSMRRYAYPYGGYIVDLGYTSDDILPVISGLKNSLWIDNATAAVFVQFSYITPSARHVTAVTLVVEFLAEGGVNLCHQTHSYRPVYIYNMVDFIVMVLQFLHILVACLVVFDLFMQCHVVRWTRQGLYAVAVDMWNVLSAINVILTLAAYTAYYYHISTGLAVNQSYKEDPGRYAAFSTPAYHNVNYFWLMSLVGFTAYMRSLKLFRGSHVVSLMMRTLARSRPELISATFVVLIFLVAFGHLGVLIFGAKKDEFRNLFSAFVSLYALIAGMEINHPEHGVSSESWWAIYFGSFMMLVIGIFLNLFAAVVGDTFHKVRHVHKLGGNLHTEVLAVAWVHEQFLLFFGIPSSRFKDKYKEARASKDSGDNEYDYYNAPPTEQTSPLAQELQELIAKHETKKPTPNA